MKHEGYTCDCGCGAQIVVEHGGSPTEQGWWTIYPGRGEGRPIHCATRECIPKAIDARRPPLRLSPGTVR